MYKICDLRLETVEESQWIRIKQVNYKQNGVQKKQEIICSHNSCGILIHNTSRDVFVFVRQFRPAVFMHEVGWESLPLNSSDCLSPSDENLEKGFTLELCAGILDKEGKTLAEIAAEEVLEECGYRVRGEDLEPVLSTRNNSLHSGTLQNLFYVKVTDDMKAEGWGGGNAEEGEFIEVVEFKVSDLLDSLFEDSLPKPIGLTFALVWFLFTKTTSETLKLPPNGRYPREMDGSRENDSKNSSDDDKGKKRTTESPGKTPSKKPRFESTDPSSCRGSGPVVTDVEVSDTRTGKELQIYRLHFKQMDFRRSWDFFYVRSVCATLVHDVSRNVFLLVRKFSPAVYGSLYQQRRMAGDRDRRPLDPSEACLTQLCSADFERGQEPCSAASDSVLKTFGYQAPSKDFKKILRSRSNVGIAGALLTLLYVKVTDKMKVEDRHPSADDRDYDIVEVPVARDDNRDDSVVDGLQLLMLQGKNPMSLALALLWYYYQSTGIRK